MPELKTPNGNTPWQLNKPIEEMSLQERYEALGYIVALLRADRGSNRNLNFYYRFKQIRATLPKKSKKVKVRVIQIPMFDIKVKGLRG